MWTFKIDRYFPFVGSEKCLVIKLITFDTLNLQVIYNKTFSQMSFSYFYTSKRAA